MIGITGQIGGVAAMFSQALARLQLNETVVALARKPVSGWNVDQWRLGSMTSERDTAELLKDVSIVYYFVLTPPNEGRTYEGLDIDVALCDAMNFARVAGSVKNLRVVLVTRFQPDDDRTVGSTWAFLREVTDIFEDNIKNLQVVETMPLWSSADAEMMGMLSYARKHDVNDQDVRFFNLVAPVTPKKLLDKLIELKELWQDNHDIPRKHVVVEGDAAVSYGALIHCMQSAFHNSLGNKLAQLIESNDVKKSAHAEVLFIQGVEFHQASYDMIKKEPDQIDIDTVFKQCRDFVEDQCDNSLLGAAVARIGVASRNEKIRSAHFVKSHSRNYVYRIARYPRRSVSEIADLFIKWIPRYFLRTIRIEVLAKNRQMYRLDRLPLAEFEKIDESWQRCRIFIKWPLAKKVDANAQLFVTVTGTCEKPREVLIVCEEGPQETWFVLMARGIMAAFGKYLRDYGVAE